ncbi:MAG: hypothetical protein R3F37_17325 [Candidatus Competibacteraceae bacterium]
MSASVGQTIAATTEAAAAVAFGPRTSTTTLDAREQFPVQSCNALNHCET